MHGTGGGGGSEGATGTGSGGNGSSAFVSFCSFGFFSGDSTSRDGAERCRLLHGSSSTLTCIRLFVGMAWAAVMGVVAGCDGSMDNRRPASQALCRILRVWTERGKPRKVGGARAGAFKTLADFLVDLRRGSMLTRLGDLCSLQVPAIRNTSLFPPSPPRPIRHIEQHPLFIAPIRTAAVQQSAIVECRLASLQQAHPRRRRLALSSFVRVHH